MFYLINNRENYGRLREAGLIIDTVSLGKKVWEFAESEATHKLFADAGITQDDVDAGAAAAQNLQDADDNPAVVINDGDDACEDCGANPGCAHTGDCPQAQDDDDEDDEDAEEAADVKDNDPNVADNKQPDEFANVAKESLRKLDVCNPTVAQAARESEQRVRELVASGLSLEDARESVMHEDIAEAIGIAVPRKNYERGRKFRENLKPLKRKSKESLISLNCFNGEITGQSDEEAQIADLTDWLKEAQKSAPTRRMRERIAGVLRKLDSTQDELIKLNCLKPIE